MNQSNPVRSILKKYKRIETYFRTIRNGKVGLSRKTLEILDLESIPYIIPLLRTFPSITTYSLEREPQWNPFNQRLILDECETQFESFGDFLESLNRLSTAIINCVHEAHHVLLLEPFFMGHYRIDNFDHFQNLSILNEAYCFWISDIICTPELEIRYPDNSLVFGKSCTSNPYFLPSKILASAGLVSQSDTLAFYLKAFSGKPPSTGKNLNLRVLKERLNTFYKNRLTILGRYFLYMKNAGIFDQFYDQFCIPFRSNHSLSFMSESQMSKVGRIDYYMESLGSLKAILRNRSDKCLALIRTRREIQTAAYFGFSLKAAIKEGRTGLSKRDTLAILPLLDEYLVQMKSSVDSLVIGESAKARNGINSANKFYEQHIRARFKAKRALLLYLPLAYPVPTNRIDRLGCLDESTRLGPSERNDLIENLLGILRSKRAEMKIKIAATNIIRQLLEVHSSSPIPRSRILIRKYNKLLFNNRMWSFENKLSNLDPKGNKYFEVLFRYL